MTALELGLSIANRSRRRRWTPAALFRAGEDGAWVDPVPVDFDPAMIFKTATDGCLIDLG